MRMRLLRYIYNPFKTIFGIVAPSPETKAIASFVKCWIAFANISVNKYITNINRLILSHLIRVFKSNSTTHYFWQIPYPSSEFESFIELLAGHGRLTITKPTSEEYHIG